jgi:hypothetical protein
MSQKHRGFGRRLGATQDAEAMSKFRQQLDELRYTSYRTINRAEIIDLLKIVTEYLEQILEDIVYTEKLEISKEHNAIGQLKYLILAFQDLDRGIAHEAFRPAANQANAALSSEQLEFDSLLLEMVAVIQVRQRCATIREAERYLAKRLQKVGVERRRHTITAATLRSLRNHPKKRQVRNPQPR